MTATDHHHSHPHPHTLHHPHLHTASHQTTSERGGRRGGREGVTRHDVRRGRAGARAPGVGRSYRTPGLSSGRLLGSPGNLAVLLALLALLGTLVPGGALCEDRCERVVPMLAHLRALWSRSFKRVGEKRVSFEEFMVSLVQASSTTGHSRAHRLGNALLNLMGQYQDCVMACEHPFSKRGADNPPPPHNYPPVTALCEKLYKQQNTSPLLESLCMTYGP